MGGVVGLVVLMFQVPSPGDMTYQSINPLVTTAM